MTCPQITLTLFFGTLKKLKVFYTKYMLQRTFLTVNMRIQLYLSIRKLV